MKTILDLIFSWPGYLWSIPIWIFILLMFTKVSSNEVLYSDLPGIIGASLLNPILYIFASVVIPLFPIMFAVFWFMEYKWDKIKDKKIF